LTRDKNVIISLSTSCHPNNAGVQHTLSCLGPIDVDKALTVVCMRLQQGSFSRGGSTHANSASTRAFLFDKDLALLRARRDADLDVFRLGVRCPTLLAGDEVPSKQKGVCPPAWLPLGPCISLNAVPPLSFVTNPIIQTSASYLGIGHKLGCKKEKNPFLSKGSYPEAVDPILTVGDQSEMWSRDRPLCHYLRYPVPE
jgi:hypothetical protein